MSSRRNYTASRRTRIVEPLGASLMRPARLHCLVSAEGFYRTAAARCAATRCSRLIRRAAILMRSAAAIARARHSAESSGSSAAKARPFLVLWRYKRASSIPRGSPFRSRYASRRAVMFSSVATMAAVPLCCAKRGTNGGCG